MINNEPIPHKQLEVGKEYYCPYRYKHRGVSGCTIEIVSKSSRKIIYYESYVASVNKGLVQGGYDTIINSYQYIATVQEAMCLSDSHYFKNKV